MCWNLRLKLFSLYRDGRVPGVLIRYMRGDNKANAGKAVKQSDLSVPGIY